MSPILGRTSGVTVFATSLERKRRAGGGAPARSANHDAPSGAVHFWDWSTGHLDYVGDGGSNYVDFDSNSDEIDINNTDLGSVPPGWGSYGVGKYGTKASSAGDIYRTSQGSIPNYAWGGDWTYDICFYTNFDTSTASHMPYAINNDSEVYGMVHYLSSGYMVSDTVNSTFGGRLGEDNQGTNTRPPEDKWVVFRFVYDASDTGSEWNNEVWYDNGSGGWTQTSGGIRSYAKTSGSQPDPANGEGRIWLNSFGTHGAGTYGRDNWYVAWSGFWESDKSGDTPHIF